MIYNSSILLVIVLFAYVTSTVNSTAFKTENNAVSASEEFPVAELTYQFLSNPKGYSNEVIAESSSKPYLCLKKFVSPLQFSHKAETVSIAITGCRTETTRPQGLCYSDECSEAERRDYHVTYDMKTSSIIDISNALVPTSVMNMDSTKYFDASVVNEIEGQKGKYICRIDQSLTPYYINNDATSFSYLLSKGCIVEQATVNNACKCDNPSSYRVVIDNNNQIKQVVSLALSEVAIGQHDKQTFDIFRATLGNSQSYSMLLRKTWSNFWFVCFKTYDPSKISTYGPERKDIVKEYVFEGCRYNDKPSPNGVCPATCTKFERMTAKIVYDYTRQTATSVTPGNIMDFFIGEHNVDM